MNQEIMYGAFVDELVKIGHIDVEMAELILKEAGLLGSAAKALKGLGGAGKGGWQAAAKMSPAEVAAMRGGKLVKPLQSLAPAGAGAQTAIRGQGLAGRMTGGGGGVGRGTLGI